MYPGEPVWLFHVERWRKMAGMDVLPELFSIAGVRLFPESKSGLTEWIRQAAEAVPGCSRASISEIFFDRSSQQVSLFSHPGRHAWIPSRA
ncbi:hypothetical protein AV656_15495 [Bhargavaea cecembensis]|uniref:Uncharacterized protein n=1 Tax=Bhargavaea cecembensis TaxID=394098 RepID=A0A165GEM0_9BACL|nr:hypothetical protein AV656_15495 [Bhargavaea cecembensis]